MKNILEKLTNKYFFAIVYMVFCFVKNIAFFNNYTKWITYLLIVYSILVLLYRFVFKRYIIFNKDMILSFFILFSVIVSSIYNGNLFIYDSIKVFLMFLLVFIVLLPEDIGINFEINQKMFDLFVLVTNYSLFIFTILSYLYSFAYGYVDRPFGINNDYITFSQNAYISVGLSFYLFIKSNNKLFRIIQVLICVIQFITLVLIQQRAAYLSFIIGVISLIVFLRSLNVDIINYFIKYKNVLFKVLFVVIIMTVFLLYSRIINFDIIFNKLISMTDSGRDIILDCGFQTMKYKSTYLFGSSYANLPVDWSSFIDTHSDWYSKNIAGSSYFERLCREAATHSAFFGQLFCHGIFGLILLILFYIKIIYSLFFVFNNSTYIKSTYVICLMSYILPAIMLSSVFDNDMYFNIVFPINVVFFVFSGFLFYLVWYIRNLQKK